MLKNGVLPPRYPTARCSEGAIFDPADKTKEAWERGGLVRLQDGSAPCAGNNYGFEYSSGYADKNCHHNKPTYRTHASGDVDRNRYLGDELPLRGAFPRCDCGEVMGLARPWTHRRTRIIEFGENCKSRGTPLSLRRASRANQFYLVIACLSLSPFPRALVEVQILDVERHLHC
jgi:hypothetical protein